MQRRFITWVIALSILTEPLRRTAALESLPPGQSEASVAAMERSKVTNRRSFLIRAGGVAAAMIAATSLGSVLGRGRGKVQQAREMLKLPITAPVVIPAGTKIGVDGVEPWRTPADKFYLIHTAIAVPTITPDEYMLRIHGMVDKELKLTYKALVGASVHGGLDHAQLRLQPGGRRPDRQRIVEWGEDLRGVGRGRRPGRCGRGAADLLATDGRAVRRWRH